MRRASLILCASALLTPSAKAFFFGWISESSVVNTPEGPVSVLDLYALFSDKDELLVGIREATITSSNAVFLHDDSAGGSWRPQATSGSAALDSHVLLGGWPGPGNSTIFPTGPSPDQADFPNGISWQDGDEVPFQGIPQPLPFINLYGVKVGRFVTSAIPEDPCSPVAKSFVLSCIVVYQPFLGGPVLEISLPHPAVFAPPILAGDVDANGNVDGNDLGLLLGSWGPCASCPADLNADGVVDSADLGLLLANWNTCE
jgi:hypothetical protein